MRDPGQLDRLARVRQPIGERAALVDDDRDVELAPGDGYGHLDLLEPRPGIQLTLPAVLGLSGDEGDRVHAEDEGPDVAGHPFGRAGGAVEPESRLELVDGIEVAGILGLLELVGERPGRRVEVLVLGVGRPR